MKGKKLGIYIGVAILVILLSFVVNYGFSGIEKTSIQNTAFVFTILAEILFFVAIYLITKEGQNTFSRAAISSLSVIYMIIAFVINTIMQGQFNQVRALATTNVIVLMVYLIIAAIVYLAKKEETDGTTK